MLGYMTDEVDSTSLANQQDVVRTSAASAPRTSPTV